MPEKLNYHKPKLVELEKDGGGDEVVEGVTCQVLEDPNDSSRDWGLITIGPEACTPRQKVEEGERTIEAYLEGRVELAITRVDGTEERYTYPSGGAGWVDVKIGDVMQ